MTKLSRQEVDEVIDQLGDMDIDQLDRVVDYIRSVYKQKRALANAKVKARLSVGDKVQLTGNYKPQYLTGLTGEITGFANTRVIVKLDRGKVGKFRDGIVRATAGGLTKIGN